MGTMQTLKMSKEAGLLWAIVIASRRFGATQGYESLCGQTLIGWWSSRSGAKQGCFWMRKKSDEEANEVSYSSRVSSCLK